MKQVRSNATRIKHLISDKLPDDHDIFGYAGITKAALLQMLDECSGLIDAIEGKKETFDVIVLKREFQILSKKCLDYLNTLPSENQASDFDSFLRNLSKIRKLINNTYLLFIKESLRPESELATIRKALEEINPLYEELTNQHTTSSQLAQEIGESHKEIQEIHTELTDVSGKIESLSKSAIDFEQKIKDSHESVEEWTTAIETAEAEITEQNKLIKAQQLAINALQTAIEGKEKAYEVLNKKLADQLKQNADFQEEIRNTIGDANRSSMAGSFKSRSDELTTPLATAERALVLVLILFGMASLYLLTSSVGAHGVNYAELSIKLPILTPFIWLAWIYTNKVGHLSRIKEDYSFKYAAAMAFEGYKQNCDEGSDLANRLLELSIENMGTNPIRLYGDVQSGPIHEIVGKAKDMVDSACSIVKSKP